MLAEWTYLVADLATNAILAEVPLSTVRISKALGAAGSMSATLPLSDRIKVDPYDLTRPCRRVVYALRDGQPWAGGVIWTARYQRSQASVQLGMGDWWTLFDHRKVLPILPGTPDAYAVAGLSTTYTGLDQNAIARALVSQAQAHAGGNFLVTADTRDSGIVRDRTYHAYELVDVGEALANLSKIIDGPEMMFDVSGPDAQGRPTRILRLGTPQLGVSGSPHVFEVDGNVIDYTWSTDGSRMASRVFVPGEGQENLALIAVGQAPGRLTDGWPLLEAEETGHSSVSDVDTLQGHADVEIALRSLPVATVSMTVTSEHDPRIGDYAPGDDATVVIPAGDLLFRAGLTTRMRIVSIDLSPGDDVETANVTLAPILEDVV